MKLLSGWIKQPIDKRDHKLMIPKRRLTLPASDDLSTGMGPQLDQATEGSCGPNTASEMICFDQLAEKSSIALPSRQFIYWCTRVLMGTTGSDSGVDNRTMLKALAQSGYCDEAVWPYLPPDGSSQGNLTTPPSDSAFALAKANAISNYAAVSQDQPTMCGCLVGGHPFMFGFSVYDQMMSDQASETGIVTMPSSGASSIGGHDITCVGYNATSGPLPGVKPGNSFPSGHFKFRNHWLNSDGTPAGDGGYYYLPFEYAVNPNLASDFWVINAVNVLNPNPIPIPPVGPTPPAPLPANSPLLLLNSAIPQGHVVILGGGRINMGTFSLPVAPGIYALVKQ